MKLKAEYISKGWGGEEIICNTDTYCGKILTIYPGKTCSIHAHPKRETFYVLEGKLLLNLWDKYRYDDIGEMVYHAISDDGLYKLVRRNGIILDPGEIYSLQACEIHSFTALGALPCKFVEFSEPHVEDEVTRYVKGD